MLDKRKIEVTWNNDRISMVAIKEPEDMVWGLWKPEEWEAGLDCSWSLEENGAGLRFQGRVPYGASGYKWLGKKYKILG